MKRKLAMATIALLIANFMGGLDATIVNTALPVIISDLNGIRLVGWVSSVFLLGTAITTVLWGRIGETIGNKRAFQISTFLFIGSSVIAGLSNSMVMLIVARAVMGIGTGGMVSIPFIIYADIYPNAAQRARALGWVTASYTLSTVSGPIIGGWLVDQFTWHWIFFINLPIGIISMLLLQWAYQDTKRQRERQAFDYAGAAVLALALILLLFAGDALAVSVLRAVLLLLAGIILLAAFWHVEGRATNPLIPHQLITAWPVQAQNLIMFLINGFFIGYSVYAPMWAQGILGTNATFGGLTQIAGSLMLLIGTRLTAHLMTKLGYKTIVLVGTTSLLISALAMVIATKNAPYWWLLISGAFEGFGMGLSFTPMQVSIQDGVEKELVSVSTTFGLLFRTLGETFLASIFGAVLSLSTTRQVATAGHGITTNMINHLSDSATAKGLDPALLPQLRTILFNGIHTIMIIGLVLIIIAFLINIRRREPKPAAR
ncbi:MFS transporter [Lapidilactobacillus salsurivasis]